MSIARTCTGCGAVCDSAVGTQTGACAVCSQQGVHLTFGDVGGRGALHFGGSVRAMWSCAPAGGADWVAHWLALPDHVARATRGRPGSPSARELAAANEELRGLFTGLYHFKDQLLHELPGGLTKGTIEARVDSDPALALVADVANTYKHVKLTRRLRSGTAPEIRRAVAVLDHQAAGWTVGVVIQHGDDTVDGVELAKRALAAWARALADWGLA